MIALESLLPDDHRVPELHICYTDTGDKTILQGSIYAEENMLFFLLHQKILKKAEVQLEKKPINTKTDAASESTSSFQKHIYINILFEEQKSGTAILGYDPSIQPLSP